MLPEEFDVSHLLQCPYIKTAMSGPPGIPALEPIDLNKVIPDTLLAQQFLREMAVNPTTMAVADTITASLWLLSMLSRLHVLIHVMSEDYVEMRALALKASNHVSAPVRAELLARIALMPGTDDSE